MGNAQRLLAAIVISGTIGVPLQATCTDLDAVEASHRAEVQSFWSELDATWLARDAKQFSRLFTKDASFGFVVRGRSLESRARILQHFREQFAKQAADLRHVTEVREIRIIAPGVVAVDGKVEVLRRSGESAEAAVIRSFAIFAVMLRSADGWKIRLLRAYRLPATSTTAGAASIEYDRTTAIRRLLGGALVARENAPAGMTRGRPVTPGEGHASFA